MGKITEVIDEKVFQSFERLFTYLKTAQAEFLAFADAAIKADEQLSKSGSMKQYEINITKVTAANDKLAEANEKVVETAKQVEEAEKKVIETAKVKAATIATSKDLLTKYSGSIEENIKMQLAVRLALSKANKDLKDLTKSYEQGNISQEDFAEQALELATIQNEGRKALMDYNLEIRRTLKETTAASGSYDQMSSTLDRLRGLYRRLTEEERDSDEIGKILIQNIQEHDKVLKQLDKSMGINNRNVGDYSKQVEDALEKTGLFSKEIAALKQAKESYTAIVKLAGLSTKSFTAILAASGIGLLLIILGGIVVYLTKFQKGMDFVKVATAAVTTFIETFVVALGKLGEDILQNILPLLKGLGTVLVGLATFNFNTIKTGFDQVSKSVDNIEPIRLTELTREAIKAAAAAAELAKQTKLLDTAEKQLNVERAKSKSRIEELKEFISDESNSLQARKQASAELFEVENKQATQALKIEQERLRIQKEQNNLVDNDTSADREKEQEIEIKIAELEAESSAKRREFHNIQKQLRKEGERMAKEREQETRQQLKADIDAEKARIEIIKESIAYEELVLSRSMQFNKKVADDTRNSLDVRLKAFEQYAEDRESQLSLEREKALLITEETENEIQKLLIDGKTKEAENLRNLLAVKILAIEREHQDNLIKLKQEETENSLALTADRIAKESILRQQGNEQANTIESLQNARLLASGNITKEEYARRKLEISRKYANLEVENEIRTVEELIKENQKLGIGTEDEAKRLAELKIKYAKLATDAQIEELEKLAAFEEQVAEARRELLREVANLGIQLINNRFEKQKEDLEKQSELIDENREKDIERINETVDSEREKEVKIAQINALADKQKQQIEQRAIKVQEKQAKFQKLADAAAIISSTARAVMAQLAITPLPIGLPLVATIAAIGAVQLAQVLTAPIPQFYKGTKSSPEGLAIVGEKGSELRIDPDGTASLTGDKPELTYLKKGTEIIPAHETKKALIDRGFMQTSQNDKDSKNLEKVITKELRAVGKKINNKSSSTMHITRSGIKKVTSTDAGWTQYLGKNL